MTTTLTDAQWSALRYIGTADAEGRFIHWADKRLDRNAVVRLLKLELLAVNVTAGYCLSPTGRALLGEATP